MVAIMTGSSLYRHDAPLAASPALTTTAGDELLALLLKGRSFANRAVGPLHGRIARPEPLGLQGTASSLATIDGSSGGHRRGNGSSIRAGGSYHG